MKYGYPLAIAFLAISTLRCQAQVKYTVSLADPARHLVHVSVEIPPGRDSHEVQLPVWNALYQVRDFSQYMNWVRAEQLDGTPLHLVQLNKSRWKLLNAGRGARIEYETFSDDPGPYGAQLNNQHAFFNLAEILIYADDAHSSREQIEFVHLPPAWKIATSLRSSGSGFEADNYDELVDSPVEIGTFDEADFTGDCGRYRIVVDADNASALLAKVKSPIQRVASAASKWMNNCPFQEYLFIYHVSDSSTGGMEHAYGTAITLPKSDVEGDLAPFVGITAHEFFHLWNVKRIRPQSLEPVDYTEENYTPALWFSEGVDSTVAEYIQMRAGFLDERHYLDHLGQQITELEDRPAHSTQSVEQSSLDAWLEKYPRYALPERSISYYNKGELLGVLLDLSMRKASHDEASLRDLFRWMNEHYAKKGKFFADSQAVRQVAEELSHADLREFFAKYVSGTVEVPWNDFFAPVGLEVIKLQAVFPDPGFEAVQKFDQQPVVESITEGSDAERAGLRTDDVILQINGQAAGKKFAEQIANLGPGAILHILVRRGNSQHQLQWKLGSREQAIFQLHDVPGISPEQKARRASWLFDSASPR